MLCAQLRIDDFCFGTNVPVEYRIESNRPVYTSGGPLESRGNVSSMPRRARDDYRRGLQGR